MNRYRKGTADSIVRRYGANVLREVRITDPDTANYTPVYWSQALRRRAVVLQIFLVGDLHHAVPSRNDLICGVLDPAIALTIHDPIEAATGL